MNSTIIHLLGFLGIIFCSIALTTTAAVSIIKNKSNIKKHEIAEKTVGEGKRVKNVMTSLWTRSREGAASSKSCKIFFNKHEEDKIPLCEWNMVVKNACGGAECWFWIFFGNFQSFKVKKFENFGKFRRPFTSSPRYKVVISCMTMIKLLNGDHLKEKNSTTGKIVSITLL